MTAVITISTPPDGTLGLNPAIPIVIVADCDIGVFQLPGVFIDFLNGPAVVAGVVQPGWTYSPVLSLADRRLTATLIRTGNWLPNSNYGATVPPPAYADRFLSILANTSAFETASQYFGIDFTTGPVVPVSTQNRLFNAVLVDLG